MSDSTGRPTAEGQQNNAANGADRHGSVAGDDPREALVVLVEHRPEWYGLDPIHVRRRCQAAAWHDFLAPWAEDRPFTAAPASLRRWLRVRLLAPERRWLFGREQVRAQPAARLADGSVLSLY